MLGKGGAWEPTSEQISKSVVSSEQIRQLLIGNPKDAIKLMRNKDEEIRRLAAFWSNAYISALVLDRPENVKAIISDVIALLDSPDEYIRFRAKTILANIYGEMPGPRLLKKYMPKIRYIVKPEINL